MILGITSLEHHLTGFSRAPGFPFSGKPFYPNFTNIPPGVVQQPTPVRGQKLDNRFKYEETEEEVEENENGAIKALLQCLGVSSQPETLLLLLLCSKSYSGSYTMKCKREGEGGGRSCQQHVKLAWLISKQQNQQPRLYQPRPQWVLLSSSTPCWRITGLGLF